MKEMLFDEIVTDEYGTWSQVCDKCAEKCASLGCLSNIACDNLICGVLGCENEALYYFDFSKAVFQ